MAEKPPPPQDERNFLTSDLSISGNFEQLWYLWQKSPPPPRMRETFFDFRSIHFRQFRATLVFVAEKPPPFLPFCQGLGSCHTERIPKVPILQIHTQIPPIQISSIGYHLCQLFKIHIQNYRTQNHGAYEMSIGSPTTIHTNIPAITVTLLAKEL